MSFFADILRSTKSGRFYFGHAEDVPKRLEEHNAGRVVSTRGRGPWELFHTAEFATRAEAARQERAWKRCKNRKWIEQLVRASR